MAETIEKRLREIERLKTRGVVTEEEYQARRAAIISDAGTQEKGRGPIGMILGLIGGIFKFGLLAVGGLVLILVVIVIVALAASGGSSADLEDTRVAFAQGSSGMVETAGDVKTKVTIDQMTDPATSSNPFSAPKGGHHFVAIRITVENAGEKETKGSIAGLKLRTTDGFEYDRTYVAGLGSFDEDPLKNLTSGGKSSGIVVFEVANGSQIQWLKYDPNPFAKGDLYFDR